MTAQLTASQIDRARMCPASFALPIVTLPSSFDANKGTAIHHFLEVLIKKGRVVALAEVPLDAPWRSTCENLYIDEIIKDAKNLECEISIAYNPLTRNARILGSQLGREYNLTENEIAGTTDLLLRKVDGSVLVIDYKTGHTPVYAANSGQLSFLGLAVARALNLTEVSTAIVQIYENGDFRYDEVILTSQALESISNSISSIFTKVTETRAQVANGQVPDVYVGEHCNYCPAFRTCPAHVNLARELISQHQSITSTIKEMSPKEAGMVWEKLTYAKKVLEEIEQGLKALIDQQPIPLPDGEKEIARIDSTRETIIGRVAVDVLYEHLGDLAQDIIEPSVSKTNLENTIKKNAASNQEAHSTINEVMISLRQVGAIKESPVVSYRPRAIRHKLTR